jgi:Phage integrase family
VTTETVLVTCAASGWQLRRRIWLRACQLAGLSGVHFHDLRHTGNQLAANEGANLRELMDRMGQSSTQAALIYLHRSDERQQAIADAISERARMARSGSKRRQSRAKRSGTDVARDSTVDLEFQCSCWWAWEDLNLRPLPYQGSALTV